MTHQPDSRYGSRNVPKMINQIDDLRKAIRAEGSPLIQETWDTVEEHIDYAYRQDPAPSHCKPLSNWERVRRLEEARWTTRGDYWKARAEKAEAHVAELEAALQAALSPVGGEP